MTGTPGTPPGTPENNRRVVIPKLTMQSPLFGPCNLIPHGMDEEPSSPVGYVALEGQENTAFVAIHHKGEWRGRNMKPFPARVVGWYSVEKADGSPVF